MILLSDDEEPHFPDVSQADIDGLLAFGGKLNTTWLLEAYKSGIFPWFNEGDPILWWSPDPRMVLFPNELKVSKSMRSLLKKKVFKVTFNSCFDRVISNCANVKREGQDGTWITLSMENSYIELNKLGFAHSVEVWDNQDLVGGLYGIIIGEVFFGESMFSKVSNASKYGFIHAVRQFEKKGIQLIDCQVYSKHLESLGAKEISRTEFIERLSVGTEKGERLTIE